jgi:hypothetical protein
MAGTKQGISALLEVATCTNSEAISNRPEQKIAGRNGVPEAGSKSGLSSDFMTTTEDH